MAGRVEADVVHPLQRRLLPADPVEPGDLLVEPLRRRPVAHPELVLLGIEILLAPGAHRGALEQLEPAVDPVERGQRAGEQEADPEGRRAALLQELVENVRRVGEEVPPEIVHHFRSGQLGGVLGQLGGAVAPGEIGVRLGEPELGQRLHPLGPGERLGQEDHVGKLPLDVGDDPLPEGERLGVRVVHPEGADAVADPEPEEIPAGVPERLPVVAPEVERIDVLVLLGRVLGVLDGAVGADEEPLRVLPDPGMVGRALQRVVERHLEAEGAGGGHKAAEVGQRPQRRVDRVVTAGLVPDRPGAPRISGAGDQGVVGTLPVGPADRMDRGQVDHVEAQRRDPGEGPGGIGEGAVAARVVGGGSGEEFVPGRHARGAPVGPDPELSLRPGQAFERGVDRHQGVEIGGERGADPRRRIGADVAQNGGVLQEPGVVGAPGVRLGRADQLGPFDQLGPDILRRRDLLLQLVPPAREPIGPGLDREPPFAGPVERHRAVPAIIVEHVAERHTRGAALAGWPDEGPRRQRVVPVLEDVGAHPQLVTDQSLDRVAAGVDDRSDAADDQTGRIRVGDALGDASRVHGTHCSAIRFGRKPPWAAGDARHTASPVPPRWE